MHEVSSVREQQVLSEPKVEYYKAGLQYEFADEYLPNGLPQVIVFKVVEADGEVEDVLDLDY